MLRTDLVRCKISFWRFEDKKTGEGGGEGRGGNEIWQNTIAWATRQNLAHASTAHALNLTCFHVYSTDIEIDTALRFALKKRGSLNLKPKTQALICFEGCSAAGQHVLAVLPTGYSKNWTDLRAVAAKHVAGNRNVSVL